MFLPSNWPDLTLSVGSVILDIAVISSITHHERKPPIIMSLLFTAVVFTQAIVYGHYMDWIAFTTTTIGAIEWCILCLQVAFFMRHEEDGQKGKKHKRMDKNEG